MKRFLTTTALALTMATAAVADNHGATDWSAQVEATEGQFFGSDLIGMRVYRADTEYENNGTVANDAYTEWDDIGEINDLIISRDGKVDAVLLGIGGFLGIGEQDAAIRMSDIRIVQEDDDPDDVFLVVNATKEELGMIPAYERDMAESDMAADEKVEMAEGDQAEMTDEAGTIPALRRPEMAREGYEEVDLTEATKMTAEDLQGARVYGTNDEDMGEISEILLDGDKVTGAVIDVGGFLGMGEKPVAVDFDKLQILRNADGSDVRVYMDSTQEALEAQPDYQGD